MCHQGSGLLSPTCHFWCMSSRSLCDSNWAIADLTTTQCKGRRGEGQSHVAVRELSWYVSVLFNFFFKSRRKPSSRIFPTDFPLNLISYMSVTCPLLAARETRNLIFSEMVASAEPSWKNGVGPGYWGTNQETLPCSFMLVLSFEKFYYHSFYLE